MVEQDTIRLLRECDAGIKMGVKSIDDVRGRVRSEELRQKLVKCRDEHIKLENEIETLLEQYGEGSFSKKPGKNPNPVAEVMSKVKTEAMLAADCSDSTIAGLMTDGCNMGVKSLGRYLNQYEAADERSKDIAKKLIANEKQLADDVMSFL